MRVIGLTAALQLDQAWHEGVTPKPQEAPEVKFYFLGATLEGLRRVSHPPTGGGHLAIRRPGTLFPQRVLEIVGGLLTVVEPREVPE